MSVIRFKAAKTWRVDLYGPLVKFVGYQQLELKIKSLKPDWQPPESIPRVEIGAENEFWIAVHSKLANKNYVYLAIYQNRPLLLNENGDPLNDDFLVNVDGDPHESIGWVTNKNHYEFDDFYEAIDFNDDYHLLAWAEYQPPAFTGLDNGGAA
ncbi:hypothetical protein [Shewanella sp. T24-MNA-CIBAN-0130]|uniref:hypothetical protein n=1 Tax=Shewanella sp. T24-MNA-CIBAN-0130 TaxID=3140470 RepID=UPI003333A1E3